MLQGNKIVARPQMPIAPEVLSRSGGRGLHVVRHCPTLSLGRQSMVKVVIQRLVSLPELDHVPNDRVRREFLNQDARHKIRDEVHFLFAHP